MDIWVPVVVALVTGAVAWISVLINHWLAKRDLRAQIKADYELFSAMEDGVEKRPLQVSLETRIKQLALQSIPLEGSYRISVMKARAACALAFTGLGWALTVFYRATEKVEAQGGQWEMLPWLIERPWVPFAVACVAALLLGRTSGRIATTTAKARSDQYEQHLARITARENGPGSAGTPPDPADTA